MREYPKLFIDGQWVNPTALKTVELSDPTTGAPFAKVAMGGVEDVDGAVAAARRAFAAYSQTSVADRIALFDRIIAAYEARMDELSAVIAEEMGCPVSARVQVSGPLTHFRQARTVLESYHFESRIGDTIIRREPIGVCALVSPWNWPIQTLTVKIAYALAAGCTVVCKPSQVTPISAILLTEVLEAAEVPRGVVNLVLGGGSDGRRSSCRPPGCGSDFVHGLDRGRCACRRGCRTVDQTRIAGARREIREHRSSRR